MKTILLTACCFILCCIGFLACKKDDPGDNGITCSATSPLIYRNGTSVVILPTAFTPNNDGLNDEFWTMYSSLNITDYNMTITSTSNNVVYHSTDIYEHWSTNTNGGIVAGRYNVSIHFRTLSGVGVDTCNTVTVLSSDALKHCTITNGQTYYFADQVDGMGTEGFNVPTAEKICP